MRPDRLHGTDRESFRALRGSALRTARAWSYKDLASKLWGYIRRGVAERAWERWCASAIRCRLEPIKRVARMIRRYWEGVINAATSDITNAMSESLNAGIQRIKRNACGFRNRDRFRNAIYFHFGGLDLYPLSFSIHSNV